ncbi:MAG: ABC transporter permease [Anaerolineales bacterium]|nr:MAG: ABC transporter permease [Anaerolineales bacterium]
MLLNNTMGSLRKPLAFLARDLSLMLSYRLSFFLQFFGIFFSVLMFFFIARLFGPAATPYLAAYGGDYFSFVLIGIAFSGYLGVAISSFSSSIRQGQMMGTLEVMLVTPTRLSTILVSSSLWSFAFTSLRIVVYLAVGALVFGVNLNQANWLAALLIQALTILTFGSLGIISASFIMAFKQGNPLNMVLGTASSLLGGVYYPITVLPTWLQPFSHLLPITYSLRAMRLAILQGHSFAALAPDMLILAVFAIVLFPLSLVAFRLGVRKAKMDGSLTQF